MTILVCIWFRLLLWAEKSLFVPFFWTNQIPPPWLSEFQTFVSNKKCIQNCNTWLRNTANWQVKAEGISRKTAVITWSLFLSNRFCCNVQTVHCDIDNLEVEGAHHARSIFSMNEKIILQNENVLVLDRDSSGISIDIFYPCFQDMPPSQPQRSWVNTSCVAVAMLGLSLSFFSTRQLYDDPKRQCLLSKK